MLTPRARYVAGIPAFLLLLAFAGCKSDTSSSTAESASSTPSPTHAQISNTLTATATVVAIDTPLRIVTLQREDGSQFRVRCGDEVRNFSELAVGDALKVKYQETLAATILSADDKGAPAEAAVGAARAKPGSKPGAGVGAAIALRVKVESIDREKNVVVFSLSSGELFARKVVTPEGRNFVKGLKAGDRVRLEYTEILAMGVEKL